MAEPQQPTENQIKAANEAEKQKWEGDFKEEDLAVPYKREAEDKQEDKQDDVDAEEKDADKGKDTPEEDDKQDEPADEPEPTVTVEDPGEYVAADYSFEVVDKNGKTVKITTPEEAEKFSDDDENFKTARDLKDFLSKSQKMEAKLDRDYEKWEAKHKTFTEQLEIETQRREQVNSYVGEFKYLVNKGLLPAVAKEYADADWSDAEVAKQPGVKEQLELLSYMLKENKERAKAGVKPLTSIVDTYNAMQADPAKQKANEAKVAEEAKKKADGEARKAAGARVAGVSPAQQGSFVPKGIAVGNPNVLKRGAAMWDD